MSRQKKLSDKPIATVLSPEDEARFEAERLRRGITRSELAREKISAHLIGEMKDRVVIISKLREICEVIGDNDWPDDLHIADILEKHIMKHLEL